MSAPTIERKPDGRSVTVWPHTTSRTPKWSTTVTHEAAPVRFSFSQSIWNAHQRCRLAIIAEVKRKSPSRGNLASGLDVTQAVQAYERGGAAAISVLTNESKFGARNTDLQEAREACSLPILRKDFLSSLRDIEQSKNMGANAVLLIVADLQDASPGLLERMLSEVKAMDMEALVEVRNKQEIEAAKDAGAGIIAVNQRGNPKSSTHTVDYGRAVALAEHLPNDALKVAASGIGVKDGTPPSGIIEAGYAAALVGESLVTAACPATAVSRIANGEMPPLVP